MRDVHWIAVVAFVFLASAVAMAQEAKPAQPSAEELGQKLTNPVSDLVSIPLQMNFIEGVGDLQGRDVHGQQRVHGELGGDDRRRVDDPDPGLQS